MNLKKTWTPIEDDVIRKAVEEMAGKPRWKVIAEKVNQLFIHYDSQNKRTPKQCRQRWHNKLDPLILDKQWQDDEINKLFQLHNEHGNKWSLIATIMNGRNDNCVKNKFYSTLRKGMRKMNKYIVNLKRKLSLNKSVCIKEFKDVVLSKLIAVSDKKYDDKLNIKQNSRTKTQQNSQAIKLALVKVSNNQDDYLGHVQNGTADNLYLVQQSLLKNIQEFCRNCKRKKGKRKDEDEDQPLSEMVDQEQLFVVSDKMYRQPMMNSKMRANKHVGHMSGNQAVQIGAAQDLRQNVFTKIDIEGQSGVALKNTIVRKDNLEDKMPTYPRISAIPTQENCYIQEVFRKNKNQHQNPLSFFDNIPSIIPNIDFLKTDQNNKLSNNFRVEGIFLQGNLNNTLQNSTNNVNLGLSNPNFFGQRSGSLGFLSRSRNMQNPFEINLAGNNYTSSSYSSNTNKQQQKFAQIFQNIQRSEKKEYKQNLQRSIQNFSIMQSLQLGDLLRRNSQMHN